VASIGPTLENKEIIHKAIQAGAKWFRLPFGYRHRAHLEHAQLIRSIAKELNTSLNLLIDIPSARPRTLLKQAVNIKFEDKALFFDVDFSSASNDMDDIGNIIPIPMKNFLNIMNEIQISHRILLLDGRMQFRVIEKTPNGVIAQMQRVGSYTLKEGNSLVLPDTLCRYPLLTEDDDKLLKSFAQSQVIPLSFASNRQDIEFARSKISQIFSSTISLMAKIETREAVEKQLEIIGASDGIMVARGDLGLAVEYKELPSIQEKLVLEAQRQEKIVVVATQILENFADLGIPQRAELSDLAVIARQRPSGIMLGKETVYSKYPIETIKLAQDVIVFEQNRLDTMSNQLNPSLMPRSQSFSKHHIPKILAIEGPNGVGKSTLIKQIKELHDIPCYLGVPEQFMEPQLKKRMIFDADWLASALYFFSGSIEMMREVSTLKTPLVVFDRTIWSTLAAHYCRDSKRLTHLLKILNCFGGHVQLPYMTIILSASYETCQSRIENKNLQEKFFDQDTKNMFEEEMKFYNWLRQQDIQVRTINTEGLDPKAVYLEVLPIIQEILSY